MIVSIVNTAKFYKRKLFFVVFNNIHVFGLGLGLGLGLGCYCSNSPGSGCVLDGTLAEIKIWTRAHFRFFKTSQSVHEVNKKCR